MEYVYVADFGDAVKIGYSTNVKSRIKQLEYRKGRRVKSLYYEKAERPTEKQLHHYFRDRRKEGEYFAIPFEDAKRILSDAVANPEKYAFPVRYTEAQKQSAKKWDAANLDRLSLALPKGDKERIKAHAAAQGESVNGFIKRAIDETMQRDKGKP